MGKIFKEIQDLVEDGGKYDIPEVEHESNKEGKTPSSPDPTPKKGKNDPKPPETEPQKFQEKETPSESEKFDHTKQDREKPTDSSTFEHQNKEDLKPEKTSPFEHEERSDRDIRKTSPFELEERDEGPKEAQPFDHVSEARNRPTSSEEFDHVSESDRVDIRNSSKFPHQENVKGEPNETSPFDHQKNIKEGPRESSQFDHEPNDQLKPSDTSPFGHEQDESLNPSETERFSHQENKDLIPSETKQFQHEEDESLRPSEKEPFGHEENKNLTPNDTTEFQHEEDESLTPNETTEFQHEEDESLTPSETTEFQHEEDKELRPPDDQIFVHEENKNLTPSSSNSFVHDENESLRPSDSQVFRHEEDESLLPTDDQPFVHEEDENLRPTDSQIFQHEEDESLRPSDDQLFIHESNESLIPPPTEAFQHEEDESLRPSDDQIFIHEEDQSLRPSSSEVFEHEEDESLRPSDDEVFGHEENEQLLPSDTQPFQHEEDEGLRPTGGQIFQHEEDETLRPPDDEIFQHQERGVRPSDVYPGDAVYIGPVGNLRESIENENTTGVFWSRSDGVVGISSGPEIPESIGGVEDELRVSGLGTYWTREGVAKISSGSEIPLDIETIVESFEGESGGVFWNREEGVVGVKSEQDNQSSTNEEIREDHFDRFQHVGGFNLNPSKTEAPYYPLIRPESNAAERRGQDSRSFPLQATLEDQQRLANFQTSPKGLIFEAKQSALQLFNPRPRTRIYNPASLNQSAVPYVHTNRHLGADDGSLGSLLDEVPQTSDTIKSSKFSDEIEEVTEGRGYLINSVPDPDDIEEGKTAEDFAKQASVSISERIDDVVYRYHSGRRVESKMEKIKDSALSVLGGKGNSNRVRFSYFLGTQPNTGFYTRDGVFVKPRGSKKYLSFNFKFPYVRNASEVKYPVGGSSSIPNFSFRESLTTEEADAFDEIQAQRQREQSGGPAGDILSGSVGRGSGNDVGKKQRLRSEISEKIDGASSDVRSSRNVARSFYGRSDGIGSIAEYENLPKQTDDSSIGRGEGPGMKPSEDTQEEGNSSFYQKEISEESPLSSKDHGPEIILHQGHDNEGEKSYGFPNYREDGPNQDTGDLVGELGVIDLDSDNPVVGDYEFEKSSGEKFEDLVPFRIRDKQNNNLLVFRSFFNSISMNSTVNWQSQEYLGRPEQFHIYSGANREMQVSFELHPFSHDGLKAQWEKLNYLQGLIYPADYVFLGSDDQNDDSQDRTNVGAYMIPPFLELTVGDIYKKQNGFISSLSINPEGETTWSMVKKEKLPEHVSVDISYTIIEETAAQTGTKFYDTKAVPNPEA